MQTEILRLENEKNSIMDKNRNDIEILESNINKL
jgi:hypothetical protein